MLRLLLDAQHFTEMIGCLLRILRLTRRPLGDVLDRLRDLLGAVRRRLRGRRQILTRRLHGFRGGVDLAHRCTQIVRELSEIPRHRTDLILSAEIVACTYIRGIIRAQIEAGKVLHHALQIAHRCRNPLRDKGDQYRQ